jgi:hypothetical protein
MKAITNKQKVILNKETPAMKAMGFGDLFQGIQNHAAGAVVKDGTNDTTLDLSDVSPKVTSIVAVLAITKATGAAAAKLLQAEETDYTFADGVFTCVGDKSALTLIIIYK